MKRRLAGVLLSALVVSMVGVVLPATAGADTAWDGSNNIVYVPNSNPNNTKTRSRLAVAFDPGDVTNRNVAAAYSHDCTGCRTVAVAMQVIVEEGNSTTVAPQNQVYAVNYQCNSCTTFAFGYQYLLTPQQQMALDDGAREQIEGIERQVESVAASNLNYNDMTTQLDSLFAQLVQTVKNDLQSQGQRSDGVETESRQAA